MNFRYFLIEFLYRQFLYKDKDNCIFLIYIEFFAYATIAKFLMCFSPPVFIEIFRNARFAQGGTALFEGRIKGVPKPSVQWMRGDKVMSGKLYFHVI